MPYRYAELLNLHFQNDHLMQTTKFFAFRIFKAAALMLYNKHRNKLVELYLYQKKKET